MLPHRTWRLLLALLLPLLLAVVWYRATPAPAAPASVMTSLFLGSLTGSTTTTPGPADALFTTLANNATTSIDVALYDFDRASVRDALLAAKGRGLTVRVVGDNEASLDSTSGPFYQSLIAANIAVITDTKSSLMHNKFVVFDGQVTWTGSANFSNTDFSRNGNNVVVVTDTMVADIYRTEFNEMFGGTFSNDKTDNTVHTATVSGSVLEVAFAPTDGVEQRIVTALNTANTSIQVAMFTFTNQAIAQALIAAKNRGVAVEALLETVSAGSQFSARDPLCAGGVTVRVEDFTGRLHDKYAVVDGGTSSDPLIITGSTNWTANGVEANDENVLIVHDTGMASAFASDFARVRAAISPNAFVCNGDVTTTPTVVQYLPLIQKGGLADLMVSAMSIRLNTSCLDSSSQLGVRAYIENVGDAAAGPFVVEVNGAQQTVSAGLGVAQTTTLWFTGYRASEPNRAIVDATFLVAESNETNNLLSQQLPIPTPPLPCTPTSTPLPTATATPTPPTQPGTGIVITFILYDPPDTLSEYVVLRSTGSSAVDMSNWTLRDLANNTYTLPPFTLAPGAEVKVWTNSGVNDAANLYWGRSQAVWNNTGDTAILRNAGSVPEYP